MQVIQSVQFVILNTNLLKQLCCGWHKESSKAKKIKFHHEILALDWMECYRIILEILSVKYKTPVLSYVRDQK